MREREKDLGTDREIERRFHPVIEDEMLRLRHPGYLIGVEKSQRRTIGAPLGDDVKKTYNEHAKEFSRYAKWVSRRLRNPKHMFVSHILRYGTLDTKRVFLHNEYAPDAGPVSGAFQRGEDAIDRLGKDPDLLAAGPKPTHVFLCSMGWNNAQRISIDRINLLIDGIVRESREAGNPVVPLVFAITWPSRWTGGAIGRIASYPVKSHDADEVGLMVANRLLHRAIEPALRASTAKLVLIGHSFGARVLTRAMFSRPLLDHAIEQQGTTPVDLMLGLQGAFSARRFLTEKGLEGSPYAGFSDWPGAKFALTASKHDKANPIAAWVTGAYHVGSRQAIKLAAKRRNRHVFDTLVVPASGSVAVADLPARGAEPAKILHLNASAIVTKGEFDAHNNVFHQRVGALMWSLVQRYAPH